MRAGGARTAAAATVVVLMASCSSSPAESPDTAALVGGAGCPPVSLVRHGSQTTAVDADNDGGTWNLSRAVWDGVTPSLFDYPVRSDAWTRGCIEGGDVRGDIPRMWTRDQWYDAEDGGRRLGGEAFRQTMTETPGNFLRIKDSVAEDFEDGFDPNSPDASYTTYLEHVQARYIRDDCIENEDTPHAMVVRNSLFDGCFTAFAERPSGSDTAQNGSGAFSFSVYDSLVYVRPQPLGPNYCDAERVDEGRCRTTKRDGVWRGAYGIWKWSDAAAGEVVVKNTIFRLDMPSYSSCQAQEWPRGTYENVTLVWAGKGRYRTAGDCRNRLPRGVRLTTDLGVWRHAKAAWLRQ